MRRPLNAGDGERCLITVGATISPPSIPSFSCPSPSAAASRVPASPTPAPTPLTPSSSSNPTLTSAMPPPSIAARSLSRSAISSAQVRFGAAERMSLDDRRRNVLRPAAVVEEGEGENVEAGGGELGAGQEEADTGDGVGVDLTIWVRSSLHLPPRPRPQLLAQPLHLHRHTCARTLPRRLQRHTLRRRWYCTSLSRLEGSDGKCTKPIFSESVSAVKLCTGSSEREVNTGVCCSPRRPPPPPPPPSIPPLNPSPSSFFTLTSPGFAAVNAAISIDGSGFRLGCAWELEAILSRIVEGVVREDTFDAIDPAPPPPAPDDSVILPASFPHSLSHRLTKRCDSYPATRIAGVAAASLPRRGGISSSEYNGEGETSSADGPEGPAWGNERRLTAPTCSNVFFVLSTSVVRLCVFRQGIRRTPRPRRKPPLALPICAPTRLSRGAIRSHLTRQGRERM
ncbi:hypothetical protein R3P38DRAFT_3291458 [Favolaschia claudopus]|uniref:Uncharacterized protein n=1 Tax=Favolaschia claudopus TaxID=2862362 RepID=A0AAV9ZNP9_9AGAR